MQDKKENHRKYSWLRYLVPHFPAPNLYSSPDELLNLATASDPHALYDLAIKLDRGEKGYNCDPDRAIKLLLECIPGLEESGEKGDISALLKLGSLHRFEYRSKWNIRERDYYLAKAAKSGDAEALFQYARARRFTEKDNKEKLAYFEDAINAGSYHALLDIKCGFSRPEDLELNVLADKYNDLWMVKTHELAAQNQPVGLVALSSEYLQGDPSPENIDKAIDCLTEAVGTGFSRAMGFLFQLHFYGVGGDRILKDIDQAEYWLRRFGDDADIRSILSEGDKLFWGSKDETQSRLCFSLLEQVANRGSAYCQWQVSRYYLTSREQPDKAVYWAQKAAEQELPEAVSLLYYLYKNGVGIEADPEKAGLYFDKAQKLLIEKAKYSSSSTMVKIATNYLGNDDYEGNIEQARKWFLKAAEAGDRIAQKKVAEYYGDKRT